MKHNGFIIDFVIEMKNAIWYNIFVRVIPVD